MVGSQRSTSIVYANETTLGEGWQCQKDQSCDWKSRAFFVSHDNSPATGVEVGRDLRFEFSQLGDDSCQGRKPQ